MAKTTKPNKEALRRLAMQALYQIDVTRRDDTPAADELADLLDDEHDNRESRQAAARTALAAWAMREAHDALITRLTPDWPTNRQPPVDRAILRLACYEIATGAASPKITINEAVELAKYYGAENSPTFINGVLDKAAKRLTPTSDQTPAPPAADAWLDDAIRDPQNEPRSNLQ